MQESITRHSQEELYSPASDLLKEAKFNLSLCQELKEELIRRVFNPTEEEEMSFNLAGSLYILKFARSDTREVLDLIKIIEDRPSCEQITILAGDNSRRGSFVYQYSKSVGDPPSVVIANSQAAVEKIGNFLMSFGQAVIS